MKNILGAFVLLSLCLAITNTAIAQVDTPLRTQFERLRLDNDRVEEKTNSTRERIIEPVKERVRTLDINLEERRQVSEERRVRLNNQAKERIITLSTDMLNRFSVTIDRLENIAERIQTRLDTLSERGIDINEAQEKLNDSIQLIDEARAEVIAITSSLREIFSNEISREDVQEIFEIAKELVTDVRDSLVETVRILNTSNRSLEN